MNSRFISVLFCLTLFCSFSLCSQVIDKDSCNTHTWEWATSIITSVSYHPSSDLKVDLTGNVYIAGEFQDSITFGDEVYIHPYLSPGNGGYLAKYDTHGSLIWSTHFRFSYYGSLKIAIDAFNDVYLIGNFKDTLDIEGNVLISKNQSEDIFIAKYGPGKELKSLMQYGGENNDAVYDVASDQLGNIYLSAIFYDSTKIGDFILDSQEGNRYLLKFGSDNTIEWIKQYINPLGIMYFGGNYPTSIALNKNDNVILYGIYDDFVEIQGHTLIAPPSAAPPYTNATFLAEFSDDGSLVWLKQATLGENVSARLEVDRNNDIYLGGFFNNIRGAIHNDPTPFIVGDSIYSPPASYIAKFSSQGEAQWSRKIGDYNFNTVSGIAFDAQNNLYINGILYTPDINTPLKFGGQDIPPVEGYLAKYSPNGDELKLWDMGCFSYEGAEFIASDQEGNIYLTGLFQGTTYFGDHAVSMPDHRYEGDNSIYIAKLGSENPLLAAEPLTSTSRISISKIEPGKAELSWSNGDGMARIVVAKKLGRASASEIEDGDAYDDGGGVFGQGAQTGERQFVVYNGTGDHTTVSGLESDMMLYSFTSIEYNDDETCPDALNYKTEENKVSYFLTRPDRSSEGLSVHPNPFEDEINLTLRSQNRGVQALTLADNFGRPIHHFNVEAFEDVTAVKLDVSTYNLRPGVYYLKLSYSKSPGIRLIKK